MTTKKSKERIAPEAKLSKKSYKKPTLSKYGSITELTAGMGGSNFDPGHAAPSKTGHG